MKLSLLPSAGEWFRGLNIGRQEDNFEIFFIDFGNTSLVKPSLIRKMEPEFTEEPVLASACLIHGKILPECDFHI